MLQLTVKSSWKFLILREPGAILLARLDACDDIVSGDGDVPAALHGLLRDLVLAVR